METTTSLTHQCQYCQKNFQRERSLEVHLCEPKRRYQEKDTAAGRLGFQAYIKFYEQLQGSARLKTFNDFAESQYYRAFVKWGNYCVNIRAINPEQFLYWLLKNNKKIDHWCSDKLYTEYLQFWLPREHANDAVQRGITEIQDYVDLNLDLKNGIKDYFRYGSTNKICYHISTGRISPWIVYNCDSGVEFLSSLSAEPLQIVLPWIMPDIWDRKFSELPADVEFVRYVLSSAGL